MKCLANLPSVLLQITWFTPFYNKASLLYEKKFTNVPQYIHFSPFLDPLEGLESETKK